MGLADEEYQRIIAILGREPNLVELGMFAVMWSEHCSYKNSRAVLSLLPTSGRRVLQGPGENAGVVSIGNGLAVVFKIESHNHPSAVEPYQGAATGVGGIIRDIFTMGARPIALLDALRFGPLSDSRSRHLFTQVVAGIAGYGNSIGIPTVGGEVAVHESFRESPLVNVMCVGVAPASAIKKAAARGAGNLVMVVGARTGRDGMHGATFASAELSPEAMAKRSAVQVGDPFMEKLLVEACLELYGLGDDVVIGIQDMGAAGLTCSSCEMAARGGVGMEIDVSKVLRREDGMTPYEVMLSESQERMLVAVRTGSEPQVERVFRKWGLEATVVGRVTDDGILRIKDGDVVVAEVPAKALTDMAPCYTREVREPEYYRREKERDLSSVPEPDDYAIALGRLLASPRIASKEWVYGQYDHQVGTNTVVLPGRGTSVVRVPGTNMGLALTCDANSLYCYLDPWAGAAHAVTEAARNIAAAGAEPIGITDCLNLGNPEKPEVFWQFRRAVEGMAEAARALEIPVTGGNVSFYNESKRDGSVVVAIHPTPMVGMVGLVEDLSHVMTPGFKREGDVVALLGRTGDEIGASEYLSEVHGIEGGPVPAVDLEAERAVIELSLAIIRGGLLSSCHDLSEGGLAVALAEACVLGGNGKGQGARLRLPGTMRADRYLFSESGGRMLVSFRPAATSAVKEMADEYGVPVMILGEVGGMRLVIDDASHAGERARRLVDVPVSGLSQVYRGAISWALES
ncbi:MAG: phosphoribosylformylglycinamidine synthase subunit PurL [Firmicutes bacterium]|nr:phosphoribosylformylglycinamidine synthase subunit PurL [Bacillota bacterium]MDH7496450.1 phosphoribosylformylglycinamidine synthase subunit PurL [Bacillota bacterium]